MDIIEILAQNLRLARQSKKLTQEALADLSGLSSRYIGAIERANVGISITVLAQLAAALDVEPGDLLQAPSLKKTR